MTDCGGAISHGAECATLKKSWARRQGQYDADMQDGADIVLWERGFKPHTRRTVHQPKKSVFCVQHTRYATVT